MWVPGAIPRVGAIDMDLRIDDLHRAIPLYIAVFCYCSSCGNFRRGVVIRSNTKFTLWVCSWLLAWIIHGGSEIRRWA